MDLKENIVGTKDIFDGFLFKIMVHDIVLPDGTRGNREIVKHNGGVGIIAVTPERDVFMVTQYRIAADEILLEIPAGRLEKDENPYNAAKRELEEETGYRAKELIPLGEYYATPGYCTEKLMIYLATEFEFKGQHLDEGEFLNVSKIPLDDLYEMVMQNKIHDCKTAIAVLKAKAILG